MAATATALSTHFEQFKSVGGIIGTVVSALFLFAIAVANLIILRSVWHTYRHVRNGGRYVDEDFDILLNSRGLLARLFRPLFRLVSTGWHMFPLGFLFGLGFDTATEVALLGISATQAAQGVSVWSIMVFPALFAAGMSLIDTTDGVLMLGAYNWAFVKPIRKLYYNLTITFVSVVVAFLIGGIEALGLVADQLSLSGWFLGWDRRAKREFQRPRLSDHRRLYRRLGRIDRHLPLQRIGRHPADLTEQQAGLERSVDRRQRAAVARLSAAPGAPVGQAGTIPVPNDGDRVLLQAARTPERLAFAGYSEVNISLRRPVAKSKKTRIFEGSAPRPLCIK